VEDQFLIRQILDGNSNAFKFLVLRYQKSIFRYLRSFGIADPQVEEVAQDVFIKSYKALRDYNQEISQFNTWLFAIAKNCALNAISKHSYFCEVLSEDEPEDINFETPLLALEKVDLKKSLSYSIDQLPLSFRNVIALFHLNEMSLEEVAEIEQCSLGTVKSRLHRAKAMLRQIILKNYGLESL
jgi:RNA polymerase sigma factor (sigma-70 family)